MQAGKAAGAALGSALSPSRQPSTQDTLSSWSRSGGGINAYSGLATDGTSYSLAGETQGSSDYAYLDNGSSLHPYDLTSYAATLASSPGIATSSGMQTTFDSGVGDSDINWADRDHPTLLAGMSESRAPMFSLTAQDPQTFGGMTIHANSAGVYDEHYDPVWAQQQAALSAQQLVMDAGNQQRLNDFFNDGALHIVGAPVYAAVGLGKELVNGAHFVASKVYAGMAFQAARSAEFGATVRGDEAGMASAEALQNRALADAAVPVTPLLHVSDFEHTAAHALGLINPEELAVSGISLADRLASGAPAVTDLAAGAYAARAGGAIESDGMMAVRDSLPVGQDGVTKVSGMADPVGMAQLPYVRQPVADVAWEAQPVFAAQGGGFEGRVSGGVGSFVRGTSSELEFVEGEARTPEVSGNVPSTTVDAASGSHVPFVDLSAPRDIAPGFYRADPAQIRFTQSDASPFFTKGGTINSLVTDLKSGAVTADHVGDPLQVVIHNDLPFSIDNRRLVAFNMAGVNEVPIQIVSLEDQAVAARFFDRFDPIGGVGQNILITPSSGRTAAQMLLRDSGMIQGAQLDH